MRTDDPNRQVSAEQPRGKTDPDGTPWLPDGGYVHSVEVTPAKTAVPTRHDLKQVGVLAHLEYRLALRSRWAYALTLLFAVFGLMFATFSGSALGPDGMDRMVASLASLAVYLIPLVALAFGYDTIVGRDEEGWLAVTLALPVSRWRVVVGAFAGRALVLAAATIIGFSAVGTILVRDYGVAHVGTFASFLLAAVAFAVAFLAIAVAVSALAPTKTHALGVVLLVWLWFVLLHDLFALGLVTAVALPESILTVIVLANPADVFRVLVLAQLETTAGGGVNAAVASTGLSTSLLVGALLAWIVFPVIVAAIAIGRRRVS